MVGVPDRDHIWTMSRDPDLSRDEYLRLLDLKKGLGYEVERVQRVSHQWTVD